MKINTSRVELPWAVQTKDGYAGSASGNYFAFYKTKSEAEKLLAWLKRKKRWNTGKVEHMPGHAWSLGWIEL